MTAVVKVADFGARRKVEEQSPPVESDPLAGLLAMNRWGRISIEQFALARHISYQQAVTNLIKFKEAGIVKPVRTSRPGIDGRGMMLYGLTLRGHKLLRGDHPDAPERQRLKQVVHQTMHFNHRMDIMSAMITAGASLPDIGVFIKSERADFERGKPISLMVDGKTLVPDAVLETEGETGDGVTFLIEVDRGTEPIVSQSSRYAGKTIVENFARYWRFLQTVENPAAYRVLLIAHGESRIDQIMQKVPWRSMQPIGDWTPDRAFRIAEFFSAVGRTRPGVQRIRGNFWGPVWRRPGHDDFVPLLRGV